MRRGAANESEYNLQELAIALDPLDPRRVNPPDLSAFDSVLDIGCGAGQTLIATPTGGFVVGIDIDSGALQLGRTLTEKVRFVCGVAEALPFADGKFNYAIARVSLPYTNIAQSLKEMRRILKPGGQLWAVFEPVSLAIHTRLYKNARFYALLPYLTVNTLLFHFFGKSVSFVDGKYRGYQTQGGIRRAFRNAGLDVAKISQGLHIVVTGIRR